MDLFKVDKKIQMDRWDIVKYQLVTYCYLNRIHLSTHDLSCLTLLAITGSSTLENFCALARSKGIFSSNQSARNALAKAEKKGLIIKEGTNKKRISLSPDLKIQAQGNILLNFKIFHIVNEPVEAEESIAQSV